MATLLMCLAPALLGGTTSRLASDSRGMWRELPDPFGPHAGRHSAVSIPAAPAARTPMARPQREAMRLVWMHQDRLGSFGLLFAACLCLALLELRLHLRVKDKDRRLAESLAGALRGGALEFTEPASGGMTIWEAWQDDPDDAEQTEPVTLALIPSGFRVRAYGADETTQLPSRTSTLASPTRVVNEEDLLVGIPREFLRTEPTNGRTAVPHRP